MEKELPKGWVETNLDKIVFQKKGKKPIRLEPIEFKDSVPYLDIHALEKGIFRQFADKKSSNLMDEDMIAIVWDGARSGWVSKGKFGAIGSTLAALKPISVDINYIFYYLQNNFSLINTNPRGIGIPHVDPTLLWNLLVPLPPLPEQQRIVAKLDTLFGHLDALKTQLERIPQLLKEFRQKVLTQAVTGKLTEEWREGRELEEWQDVELKSVCKSITDGDHQAPPQVKEGIPFLVISNVSKGFFDFESITRFVPRSYFESLKDTRIPKKGDVLYTVTGSFGIPILVDFEGEFCFQRHIAILKPDNSKIISSFLQIVLSSTKMMEQAREVATGTAQLTVPLSGVRNFIASIPLLVEQQEIVRRVESLFAKADQIEASYQKLIAKIEQLPQALLAKAFRGELVPQLPTDGDARDLLEQIKRAKEGSEKGGKGKKMKVEDELRMVAEDGARYGKK